MFLRALALAAVVLCGLDGEWAAFKRAHLRFYAPSEEEYRFGVFAQNMKLAALLNRLDAHAVYGASKFADLSPSEFAALRLGPIPAMCAAAPTHVASVGAPARWDWGEHIALDEPLDQGDGPAGWMHAAVCALEAAAKISGDVQGDLFEGWEFGCNRTDVGREQLCLHAEAFGPVPSDELQMADALYARGPLMAALHAAPAQLYIRGVMSLAPCATGAPDHAVALVGYDLTADPPFWRARNSWGADWGEEGYYRLIFGRDVCGIARDAVCVWDRGWFGRVVKA